MNKNERSIDNHLGCSGESGRNSVIVCCHIIPNYGVQYFSIAMTVVKTKRFLHKHESRRLILFKLPCLFVTILCSSCMVKMIMPGRYCYLFRKCIKYQVVVVIDESLSWKYHIAFVCSFHISKLWNDIEIKANKTFQCNE